jgi:hypothetical protein
MVLRRLLRGGWGISNFGRRNFSVPSFSYWATAIAWRFVYAVSGAALSLARNDRGVNPQSAFAKSDLQMRWTRTHAVQRMNRR